MSGIRFHCVDANGIRIHLAEQGEGPLVLMVHGFPESWYSWRYQLPALAAAGYRAVAMDVRGYGRSSKPSRVEDYRMVQKVADVVGVVKALGGGPATIVGHDWGAPIAWNSALLRPDLFRGVAGLSVPYAPPHGPTRPLAGMRAMAGDNEFYIEYFQQPGRAEAEIEADVRGWLLGFYWCASGDIENGPNIAMVDRGRTLREKFVHPETMPAWMSEADLDVYTREFEYSGFFGPLGRYRNVDRDWEDLAAFAYRPIEVPALFIGGSKDGPTIWGKPAIDRFPETLPKLHQSVILDGCGHWVQQERADETNALLLDFLAAIH
ncbi:MAG: alpha/beta hydrolase [Gammaproteobacteria bacterium]|nr:MAG: alpha/beta hydrolase [Gammaproteobacteria bacterium]